MKKLEVSEQFVREAYESACQTWKTRIKEEFPSLFEVKPIIGKWFKRNDGDIDNKFMGLITEGDLGSQIKGYGVDYFGKWVDNDFDLGGSNWIAYTEATPQEIESMLWKEAEKRGIGKDTKLEYHSDGQLTDLNDLRYTSCYDIDNDRLWNKNGLVYQKSKWAKPLDLNKEIKEQISRLEKELKELKDKVK